MPIKRSTIVKFVAADILLTLYFLQRKREYDKNFQIEKRWRFFAFGNEKRTPRFIVNY